MSLWLVIPLTALLSAGLTLGGIYLVYRNHIKPELDSRILEIKKEVAGLEDRVSAGVRQGIGDALRDVSDRAVRSTTRSVVRMGADLVEGGLSSFLNNERNRRRDDDPHL